MRPSWILTAFLAWSACAAAARADAGDDQYAVAAGNYAHGRWDLATKEFRDFIKAYPKHPRANRAIFYLGEALVQQNKFADAAPYFTDFMKRDPGNPLAKQALFRAGEAAYMTGQGDDAQEKLHQFLEHYPDDKLNGYAIPYLGDLAVARDDPKTAENYYNEGLQHFPHGPLADDCRFGLARTLQMQGDLKQAIKLYGELAAKSGSDLADSAQFQLGAIYYSQKKYDDADLALKNFDVAFPDSRWVNKARVLRAKTLTQQGDFAASQLLLEAASRAPEIQSGEWNLEYQLTRGENFVAEQKYKAAVEPLEAFLRVQPRGGDSLQAIANLVVAKAQLKDLATAKLQFANFCDQKPPDELRLPVTQNLADAAFAAGDKAWAAELYSALSAAGNPPHYIKQGLAGLARCQVQSEKLTDANSTLERLVNEYPDDAKTAEAAFLRGRVLEQNGQLDPALSMYQLVLDKFADSREAPQAMLAAARLHEKQHQGELAASLYEQFVDRFPKSKDVDAALYGWAWALRDLNKPDRADALFQRLHAEFPESKYWPDATYRLAERSLAAKKYDQADALLDSLLKAKLDSAMKQHALYLRGQVAIAAERWPEVSERMSALATEFPQGELRLPADYWTAEAAYRQNNFTKAGELYTALAAQIGGRKENWLALVPLRQAQVLAQEKKWDQAAEIAARIETDFPGFEQQYEADYLLGRCKASQADFEGARQAYQKVLRSPTGGKSETAAMAQWMIGETYFHQTQFEAALREYLRVEPLYDYPRWQAASLLQAGKCYEKLGRTREAAETYGRVLQAYPQTEFTDEAKSRLNAVQAQTANKPMNKAG
ncbi:MAG TPA: tetratricopeptide repeat protein [Pirellulales bacterium]|nr:tetratricopeptide repeat protein [Pirellulales bacterium]